MRSGLKNLLAFLLPDAPEDAEYLPSGARLAELVQARKNLLRGFFPDATRVVENQVGLLRAFDGPVARLDQRARDFFRVVHVHLASERLDEKGLRHRSRTSCPLAPGFPTAQNYSIIPRFS